MPVPLTHIRDTLLPGLYSITYDYRTYTVEGRDMYGKEMVETISMPVKRKLKVIEAISLGAAAILAKNPIVSRRWWSRGGS